MEKSLYKIIIVLAVLMVIAVAALASMGSEELAQAFPIGSSADLKAGQLLIVTETVVIGTATLEGHAILVVVIRGKEAQSLYNMTKHPNLWFEDQKLLVMLDLSKRI